MAALEGRRPHPSRLAQIALAPQDDGLIRSSPRKRGSSRRLRLCPDYAIMKTMMTETESIVLEHLRHIRTSVDGLRDDMREVKQRVGSLETQVAQLTVRVAEVSTRVDRMGNRLERIESRLGLTEA